jgi:thioredoxin-like negative regulator of GroEL
VNVEDNLDLASELGVKSVPTLVGFVAGKEVSRSVGYAGERGITKILDAFSSV